MKVTLETTNMGEIERIKTTVNQLKHTHVQWIDENPAPTITKGDKSLNPTALFGIWKNNPRKLEVIRSEAWKR